MADGFGEEDIFAVFEQESPADGLKKRKHGNKESETASSSSLDPQSGEKRDIKEVLNDPLLFDVEDTGSPDTANFVKKQKVEDTER